MKIKIIEENTALSGQKLIYLQKIKKLHLDVL